MKEIKYPEICPTCRKEMAEIVRIRNGNTSYACTNPKCSLRINLNKVKSWKKK